VREKRTKRLELRLPVDLATDERLAKLAEIAKQYAGATPVAVSLLFSNEAEALIGNTALKVQVSDELIQSVERLFGMKVVEFG
jgi:DNA polymerase III subunit alpha